MLLSHVSMQLFEVCDLVRPMAAMLWSNQQYWDWGELGSRYNHRFEDFTHRGYYILRACKIFLNAVFLSDHCLPWFILFILKQMWTDSQPQANCPFLGGGLLLEPSSKRSPGRPRNSCSARYFFRTCRPRHLACSLGGQQVWKKTSLRNQPDKEMIRLK